jgi:hypothetical protein
VLRIKQRYAINQTPCRTQFRQTENARRNRDNYLNRHGAKKQTPIFATHKRGSQGISDRAYPTKNNRSQPTACITELAFQKPYFQKRTCHFQTDPHPGQNLFSRDNQVRERIDRNLKSNLWRFQF